jgi:hypothetical protein
VPLLLLLLDEGRKILVQRNAERSEGRLLDFAF